MTVHEPPIPDNGRFADAPLELLSDGEDDDVWTAVPVDATGDDRVTKWLSIDVASLCDLEAWR